MLQLLLAPLVLLNEQEGVRGRNLTGGVSGRVLGAWRQVVVRP